MAGASDAPFLNITDTQPGEQRDGRATNLPVVPTTERLQISWTGSESDKRQMWRRENWTRR